MLFTKYVASPEVASRTRSAPYRVAYTALPPWWTDYVVG